MRRHTAIFAALLIVSLAASAVIVTRVDQLRAGSTLEDVLYIPSSVVLKRLSLGYHTLLADVYWTRSVQYFGRQHHAGSLRYDLLGPLLQITTDLDPQLIPAYQFGGIFLAQQPPEGAGQPEAAIALVEKGISANPDIWQLYFNLGWIYVSELKDYKGATKVFERGSKVPKANPVLGVLAAHMAQFGGNYDTARLLWVQMYKTTQDKMIRAQAVKRLQALQVDHDVSLLEEAVADYIRVTNRYPNSIAELQANGWRGNTVDPLGNPYLIKEGGRVEVSDLAQLPFVTKGLPPSEKPSITPQLSEEQTKALKVAAEEEEHSPNGPPRIEAPDKHSTRPTQESKH
jgi:tetratricopeptide (TPR) repeat protein